VCKPHLLQIRLTERLQAILRLCRPPSCLGHRSLPDKTSMVTCSKTRRKLHLCMHACTYQRLLGLYFVSQRSTLNCLAKSVAGFESGCSCVHHCRNKDKREALGQLFERLNESLESTGAFPAIGDEATSPAKPQAHVWTMYQLAQHYDMQGRTGQHQLTWCRLMSTGVIQRRQHCNVHNAAYILPCMF
jgi:hypothetical protein